MIKLYPSFLRFTLSFFIVTCIFGLIAMLLGQFGSIFINQLISFAILLPYLISFYLMTQHFIRSHQVAPHAKQRWQLSLGCLIILWVYTFLAFMLGIWLSGTELESSALTQAFYTPFIIILASMLLGLNGLLFGLGYFFLGKPAQIMLSHQKRS